MGVEVMGTRSIALIMRFGLAMGYRGCSSEVKGLLLLMILAVKLLPRVELFEYAFPQRKILLKAKYQLERYEAKVEYDQ